MYPATLRDLLMRMAPARIVGSIDGINTDTHVWGQLLKDYRPADW